MIGALADVMAAFAGLGVVQALTASRLVASFVRTPHAAPPDPSTPYERPAVTVLKPLHGDEPLLEAALATLCRQDYPHYQIVFGVHDPADPAVGAVRRLQARFPDIDIALVIDATLHGVNRKVGNLINMMATARHDVLVIADSDVHVRPDYLDQLVATLRQPGVGLVTTLYAGLPAPSSAWPGRLGATQITHVFLPGAVLSRRFGRQDCLGATMCLRRRDLERIGGLPALAGHLADDAVLGRRIAALGLRVALAPTVPLTTVPESSFRALFRHELRWARTIRVLEPLGSAASVVQHPLAWSLLAILLAGGAPWSIGWFLITWVLRAVAALGTDSALAPLWSEERGGNDEAALAFSCPVWLLPLRDVLSVAVLLASYGGRQVKWRGYDLHADTPPPAQRPITLGPIEGINAR
ncbi:MAG TPA: bacteriohopanetetrol glucosamine biosynthesis glycosyltransferase HpnI [Rhodopila sp.]